MYVYVDYAHVKYKACLSLIYEYFQFSRHLARSYSFTSFVSCRIKYSIVPEYIRFKQMTYKNKCNKFLF